MERLYKEIITAFHSLWSMKKRGESIEIITPVATGTDKFVSIFLTLRGNDLVVTDGGWIDSGAYDAELPMYDDLFVKMYEFYTKEFGICSKVAKGRVFHFKKTSVASFLPNIVNDLAAFIGSIITASQIHLSDPKEQERRNGFNRMANEFLKDVFAENVRSGFTLEEIPMVRFSASIQDKGRMTLVNYVSGSTPNYFVSSLGRSSLGFDLLEKQAFNSYIRNKVILVDSRSNFYSSPKVQPYLELLMTKKDRMIIPWDKKDELRELILN